MKRPDISTHSSEPELVGNNDSSTWARGHNCVYHDKSVANFRVSINTSDGWRSYGHFHNLETATYVANIAIIAEHCEERYELNKEIGEKDRDELEHWRKQPGNYAIEKCARDRYKQIRAELQELEDEKNRTAKEAEEEHRLRIKLRLKELGIRDEQMDQTSNLKAQKELEIFNLSNAELVKFIKESDTSDSLHEYAVKEAVRRYKNLGLKRAT